MRNLTANELVSVYGGGSGCYVQPPVCQPWPPACSTKGTKGKGTKGKRTKGKGSKGKKGKKGKKGC